jgi:hypothetical protein
VEGGKRAGIYVQSLDGQTPRKRIVVSDSYVAVAPDPATGLMYLLYPKDEKLWAQRLDASRGELQGDPMMIAGNVGVFSVSATGTMVSRRMGAEETELTWVDRSGKRLGTIGARGDYWGFQLSPNDKRIAAVVHRVVSGYFAIWLIDIARDLDACVDSERTQPDVIMVRDSRRV